MEATLARCSLEGKEMVNLSDVIRELYLYRVHSLPF